MNKVRWGVLSTAKIGVEKVIPAMQQSLNCEIVAIASRDQQKARYMAKRLNIPMAYGSYEELMANPDIEAIYNPLPNHLHVSWSIRAIEAGKHVLCEKPIAMTVDEALKLFHVAKKHPQLKVMEAFMYRYHPQWQHAGRLVADGKIGKLQTIHSFFSYHNIDPNNVRNKADIGGGGLMDIGCYCISLSRFLCNAEPQRICGVMKFDPVFLTDRLVSGMLDFGEQISTFTCATQLEAFQRVNIVGSEGRIEIEIPFNAPSDRPCKMWHQRGGEIEEILFDVCNQYTIQGDLFSRAVLNNTEAPTPLEDAVSNMRSIEALVRSSERGSWVKISYDF